MSTGSESTISSILFVSSVPSPVTTKDRSSNENIINHISEQNGQIKWSEDESSSASDSDFDENVIPNVEKCQNFVSNALATRANSADAFCAIHSSKQNRIGSEMAKPNVGSIAVQSSSDITFGNKTFYDGPVTIKQFHLDTNKWRQNGVDNAAYVHSNGDGAIPTSKTKDNGKIYFYVLLKCYKFNISEFLCSQTFINILGQI